MIAELLASEGTSVACVARDEGDHRHEGSLNATVAGIRVKGKEAPAVALDISSDAECLR